jgi:hypothetical protein
LQTSRIGIPEWSDEVGFWVGSVASGGRDIAFWIDGRDQPDPEAVAWAEHVAEGFSAFETAVSEEIDRQASRFSDLVAELRDLRTELVVFAPGEDAGQALIWFDGSEQRAWKMPWVKGTLGLLGFEY